MGRYHELGARVILGAASLPASQGFEGRGGGSGEWGEGGEGRGSYKIQFNNSTP